jgi:hypothetical protein
MSSGKPTRVAHKEEETYIKKKLSQEIGPLVLKMVSTEIDLFCGRLETIIPAFMSHVSLNQNEELLQQIHNFLLTSAFTGSSQSPLVAFLSLFTDLLCKEGISESMVDHLELMCLKGIFYSTLLKEIKKSITKKYPYSTNDFINKKINEIVEPGNPLNRSIFEEIMANKSLSLLTDTEKGRLWGQLVFDFKHMDVSSRIFAIDNDHILRDEIWKYPLTLLAPIQRFHLIMEPNNMSKRERWTTLFKTQLQVLNLPKEIDQELSRVHDLVHFPLDKSEVKTNEAKRT